MSKKIIVTLIFSFILFTSSTKAEGSVDAHLFYGEGCPHCAKESQFLFHVLKSKYPELEIHEYEVYYNEDNSKFLEKVGKALNTNVSGVPFLVIGDKYFIGYAEGITSIQIENKVKECIEKVCVDIVGNLLKIETETKNLIEEPQLIETNLETDPEITPPINSETDPIENENQTENPETKINSIFGEINISKFSLPVLTIVMGILDGFNPCAMWVLLFLISLLLGMEDKKRMWILGVTFIVTSASVYFIFMSAWLNLILFLGFIVWVRALIGILALFGGSYNIKEFFSNKGSGCKITGDEKRQKIFQKLKTVVSQNSFWLAIGGIIALAFMVNLVELICSAGLPAIYTQVLALSGLAKWQYYLYILLYIFFFMLDDLFVFFIAMATLQMTGITTKYSRWSHLIGGILMLIIGLMLIFKPEWLMFG